MSFFIDRHEITQIGNSLEAKEAALDDLRGRWEESKEAMAKLEADVKFMSNEKSEAEEKICQLQKLAEVEKAQQADKVADLEKAKEILLDSKVEMQQSLDDCKAELKKAKTVYNDALEGREKLVLSHTKTIEELKNTHVRKLRFF